MTPDVSVLIPAFEAKPFLARAVQSVQSQAGVDAEIVVAADDAHDYAAHLSAAGLDLARVAFCRTSRTASGPSAARNLAASMARADILACLDADDMFETERLAPLLTLAERHGAATGPTVETDRTGRITRIAKPSESDDRLTARDIAGVRMPLFPVFQRSLLGEGWPDIAFAEDMIFNLQLFQAADAYAFADGARYRYIQHDASLTNAPDALVRACKAYRKILAFFQTAAWSDETIEIARTIIEKDLAAAEALLSERDSEASSWRDAMARSQGD